MGAMGLGLVLFTRNLAVAQKQGRWAVAQEKPVRVPTPPVSPARGGAGGRAAAPADEAADARRDEEEERRDDEDDEGGGGHGEL
jgi:hypothetical protein